MNLSQIITLLATVLGTGGLTSLVTHWLTIKSQKKKTDVDVSQQANQLLLETINSLTERVGKLESRIADLEKQNIDLTRSLNNNEIERLRLIEENRKLKSQIEDLLVENQKLDDKLLAYMSQYDLLVEQLTDYMNIEEPEESEE